MGYLSLYLEWEGVGYFSLYLEQEEVGYLSLYLEWEGVGYTGTPALLPIIQSYIQPYGHTSSVTIGGSRIL